ncbi:AAA family ATPase (plasmid) [Alicyclobacillus acidoterrestris]|uniref:AAA family ATPase n=1 Tax=Alicyclobacillus acidoterrestris TaxID=1450 RepID=UPI003F535FFF
MYAIGFREELLKQIRKHFNIKIEHTLSALPTSAIDERILVDSASVELPEIYEYKSARPEFKITYVVDEITPSQTHFAAAHHITLVAADRLVSYLQEEAPADNTTPILAFWGVQPRLGTTTIALSVARVLANEQNQSVGMLGLNAYNPGSWMMKERSHHLDNIHSFLKTKQLTRDLLIQSMEHSHKVRYLLGERNQTRALEYTAEEIRYLIDIARNSFDIVILDVGSILNTPLALEGLDMATHRFVVANDSMVTKEVFESQFDYVLRPLGIKREELMLVGNFLNTKGVQAFAKSLSLTPIAAIQDLPGISLYAESNQQDGLKPFWDEKPFKRAVESISQTVNVANLMAVKG